MALETVERRGSVQRRPDQPLRQRRSKCVALSTWSYARSCQLRPCCARCRACAALVSAPGRPCQPCLGQRNFGRLGAKVTCHRLSLWRRPARFWLHWPRNSSARADAVRQLLWSVCTWLVEEGIAGREAGLGSGSFCILLHWRDYRWGWSQ